MPKSRALVGYLTGGLLEGIIESFVIGQIKRYIITEDNLKELAKPINEELAEPAT